VELVDPLNEAAAATLSGAAGRAAVLSLCLSLPPSHSLSLRLLPHSNLDPNSGSACRAIWVDPSARGDPQLPESGFA